MWEFLTVGLSMVYDIQLVWFMTFSTEMMQSVFQATQKVRTDFSSLP